MTWCHSAGVMSATGANTPDAGVVDEHIETAEPLHRLADGPRGCLVVANVRVQGQRLTAQLFLR